MTLIVVKDGRDLKEVIMDRLDPRNKAQIGETKEALKISLLWCGQQEFEVFWKGPEPSFFWERPQDNCQLSKEIYRGKSGDMLIQSRLDFSLTNFSPLGLQDQFYSLGVQYKKGIGKVQLILQIFLYGELVLKPTSWDFDQEKDFKRMYDLIFNPLQGLKINKRGSENSPLPPLSF